VPVAAHVWSILWHDNNVAHANVDRAFATRAHIALARLIRLDRVHKLSIEIVGELLLTACDPACTNGHGARVGIDRENSGALRSSDPSASVDRP